MKKRYKNQKEFLFASGVFDEGSEISLEEAKKAYRKEYLKRKKAEFRRKHKEVTIAIPRKDLPQLESAAKGHSLSLPKFIRSCLGWYMEQVFIVPDEEQVQKLCILLRRIGNNINQVAMLRNNLELSEHQAVAKVQEQVNVLEDEIYRIFTAPPNLLEVLKIEAEKDPLFAQKLRQLVNTLDAQREVEQTGIAHSYPSPGSQLLLLPTDGMQTTTHQNYH
ncbi:MAG: hypothetical protein AAFZ15_30850 [Bacteroidota bacterium]